MASCGRAIARSIGAARRPPGSFRSLVTDFDGADIFATSNKANASISRKPVARNFVSSSSQRTPDATTMVTTPSPAAPAPQPALASTSAPSPDNSSRVVTKDELSKARLLMRWSWFPKASQQFAVLRTIVKGADPSSTILLPQSPPAWLGATFASAKHFRTARSRLWEPTAEELAAFLNKQPGEVDYARWIDNQLTRPAFADQGEIAAGEGGLPTRETKLDFILKPVWQSMTEEQQRQALTRVKFECARRLGWRTGYSAGFPVPQTDVADIELAVIANQIQETEQHLAKSVRTAADAASDSEGAPTVPALSPRQEGHAAKEEAEYRAALMQRKAALLKRQARLQNLKTLAEDRSARLAAMVPGAQITDETTAAINNTWAQLLQQENSLAWDDWCALSHAEREAEFKAAWKLRERSHVYIDDSPSSSILNGPLPRWYTKPQRAGQLQFLPNLTIRLVKNYTPTGEPYDAFKATFRVPLNMHKHMLRSYLLAIYGLRTTWARSSIYRSAITRNPRRGMRKERGSSKTYKKVELGLVEPFIWPEPELTFKTERLMSEDMEFERQRMHIKMTKAKRWRAKRPSDPISVTQPDGTRHTVKPQVIARAKGIPTARHSRILALLRNKKIDRENIIAEKLESLKSAAASSSSETSVV
ncbi:hypothetical protein K437DRAFT_256294 [Tilletiaria anomala UBC 951]|uniref:Large ribosomal subunit protein uL23m n=1 Tax=Tilletiaria anomala (strain ATCC 24038 / CBS 436.72 / UBC 951) TaxID=1037660 RepID=A0A066W5P5_TILAU|nr:uncharacterized protein K437DRAFT_256294 [Tilletiaria anomala UBC 951]KDN46115.1 hypothetical protein K437DRAFT_256294 [Tilletiaria anomala UBC 951]